MTEPASLKIAPEVLEAVTAGALGSPGPVMAGEGPPPFETPTGVAPFEELQPSPPKAHKLNGRPPGCKNKATLEKEENARKLHEKTIFNKWQFKRKYIMGRNPLLWKEIEAMMQALCDKHGCRVVDAKQEILRRLNEPEKLLKKVGLGPDGDVPDVPGITAPMELSGLKEKKADIATIINWVARNMAFVPSEHDAPDPQAWSLLADCKADIDIRKAFWTNLYTKLLPSKDQQNATDRFTDTNEDLKDVFRKAREVKEQKEKGEENE